MSPAYSHRPNIIAFNVKTKHVQQTTQNELNTSTKRFEVLCNSQKGMDIGQKSVVYGLNTALA